MLTKETNSAEVLAELIETIVNAQKLTFDPIEKLNILFETKLNALPFSENLDDLFLFFNCFNVWDLWTKFPNKFNGEVDFFKEAIKIYINRLLNQ